MLTVARTGWLIFALGKLRTLQGRYDDSLTAHQKALECIRVTCGESHPRVALVRHKISEHYARLGRYEEAMYVSKKTFQSRLH
jgi:predicted amino acid dehydrogenase